MIARPLLRLFVVLLVPLAVLTGCDGSAKNGRMTAEEAARFDRDQRILRERARENTMNCHMKDVRRNPDSSTVCIYSCPGGITESSHVGPGVNCPNLLNVVRR
jgi:hypothetical protein